MKQHIESLLARAIAQLITDGELPADTARAIEVERARSKEHGDFASNVALVLARSARLKPRVLAERLTRVLPRSGRIAKTEIAGPGFINFFLSASALHEVIGQILAEGDGYGRSRLGQGRRVQIEFVSANPNGPLHVGHGRGAAYGAAVANLLAAVGFDVHREYYVNNAGRQMDILAVSIWLRYLESCGEDLPFPVNGYKGAYIADIATTLRRELGPSLRRAAATVLRDIPPDEPQGGDRDAHVDALIARAQSLLGAENYRKIFDLGLNTILADIRQDLEEFGVVYDQWFSERSLAEDGAVDRAIDQLRQAGRLYEKDGALWFRATEFDDEKDRVVVRENGQKTYFAADIAYHINKLERGFKRLINVWGADHHGYVPRIKAVLAASGVDPGRLEVLLVQFAILYRGRERVQMSTRAGEFVTLRELRREVGNDAARFFYVLRKCEQHMDFDLELAKSQSNDNPVYYVQYAHARVCSVFKQLQQKGLRYDRGNGLQRLDLLDAKHESALIMKLSRYPEVVEAAAIAHEPHQLAHYLREVAYDFHSYYNTHTFLVPAAELRDARLALIEATRQVIANGLGLLGVSAPESM